MVFTNANRVRLLASLGLTCATGLLGLALLAPTARPGAVVQPQSYDSLHSLAGVRTDATAESPVLILYLDQPSYFEQKLNPSLPWPRELHAQLLRRARPGGRACCGV